MVCSSSLDTADIFDGQDAVCAVVVLEKYYPSNISSMFDNGNVSWENK